MTTIVDSWGGNGSNAYVSLTAASSFITTGVVDSAAWTSATTIQQEAALIEAARDIDSRQFIGSRYYSQQQMEWPRAIPPAGTFRTSAVDPTATSYIQQRMKTQVQCANCIQALYLLRNGGRNQHTEARASGAVRVKEEVGPIKTEYHYGKGGGNLSILCPEAISYLSPWLTTRKAFRG